MIETFTDVSDCGMDATEGEAILSFEYRADWEIYQE